MGELMNIHDGQRKEIHEFRIENRKLKRQLKQAVAQNYCKMCGNTLDGYKSIERKGGSIT